MSRLHGDLPPAKLPLRLTEQLLAQHIFSVETTFPNQVLESHVTNCTAVLSIYAYQDDLSRREVRASRRLYAGGGSCLRDLWRAWRIRDCRSA